MDFLEKNCLSLFSTDSKKEVNIKSKQNIIFYCFEVIARVIFLLPGVFQFTFEPQNFLASEDSKIHCWIRSFEILIQFFIFTHHAIFF